MNGRLFDIKRFAIHDGQGLRTTVFFKGCPLRCIWCHNPESQLGCVEYKDDELRIGEYKKGIKNSIGYSIAVNDLMKLIKADLLFYETSGGGVTFSGGEPLMQHAFLKEIMLECKKEDIHIALDTSGYAINEIFNAIVPLVDLFLFDVKLMDASEHIKYTGVSNNLILENLYYLDNLKANVRLRLPLVKHITATRDNLNKIASLIKGLQHINSLDLLPFHEMMFSKYKKLNIDVKVGASHALSGNEVNEIRNFFISNGITTNIE